jgi:Asp-tRNA(Asn)/Glu-tRNA(Gln) amidotransferase A subunit family amidase
VPLALGTQHTASTLLPASFCGAVGFKPSFAFTSMRGSNILVPRLATVGFLTRNLDDLALFASAFAQEFKAPVELLAPQRLGVVRGPAWDKVDAGARAAFDALLNTLPTAVAEIELPGEFASAVEVTHGLLAAHLAHRFAPMPEATQTTYCAPLRTAIAAGLGLRATDYLEMDGQADRLTEAAQGLFASCDALVTLSTLGEATLLSDGPGSGELTMPWSLAGLPTLSLPLLRGDRGLPIGVQLIGAPRDDRRLLSIAAWLTNVVRPQTPEAGQT